MDNQTPFAVEKEKSDLIKDACKLVKEYVNEIIDEGIVTVGDLCGEEKAFYSYASFLSHEFMYYRHCHDMPKGISQIKECAIVCYALKKFSPIKCEIKEIKFVESDEDTLAQRRKKTKSVRTYFWENFLLWFLNKTFEGLYKKPLGLQKYSADKIRYYVYHHYVTLEALIMLFEVMEADRVREGTHLMTLSDEITEIENNMEKN